MSSLLLSVSLPRSLPGLDVLWSHGSCYATAVEGRRTRTDGRNERTNVDFLQNVESHEVAGCPPFKLLAPPPPRCVRSTCSKRLTKGDDVVGFSPYSLVLTRGGQRAIFTKSSSKLTNIIITSSLVNVSVTNSIAISFADLFRFGAFSFYVFIPL